MSHRTTRTTLPCSPCHEQMERVSLDELAKCMSTLTNALSAVATGGIQLPRCLILRLVSTTNTPRLPMPVQLLELHADNNAHFNMRLVRWLTKLEKTLSTLTVRRHERRARQPREGHAHEWRGDPGGKPPPNFAHHSHAAASLQRP